ncbi:MAG: hypothetical protein WCQ49_02510 [Candidatus Saccharibacteria bacterium]
MKNEKIANPASTNNANLNAKKPEIIKKPFTRKPGQTMDVARSKNIRHFTPLTKPASRAPQHTPDIKHVRHPLAVRTDHIRQSLAKAIAHPKTLKEIKNEAISEAMQRPEPIQPKTGFFKKNKKFINIFSISLAVLIITAAIVYFNIPAISVRVASMQSGINATFPQYRPDGYSVNGPVSFKDGEVTINFKANTNDTKFTIRQIKSAWDSSAVRNKVNKDSSGEFITTEEKGLTIFTYNGNAAWVNGGILYSINGNAPLSGDQIRRIATSL